jgi:hypothetical protein
LQYFPLDFVQTGLALHWKVCHQWPALPSPCITGLFYPCGFWGRQQRSRVLWCPQTATPPPPPGFMAGSQAPVALNENHFDDFPLEAENFIKQIPVFRPNFARSCGPSPYTFRVWLPAPGPVPPPDQTLLPHLGTVAVQGENTNLNIVALTQSFSFQATSRVVSMAGFQGSLARHNCN